MIKTVKKALINLYIEGGDSKALFAAIKDNKNYDARVLALELEKHAAAEFRAISAYLFCVFFLFISSFYFSDFRKNSKN